MARLTVLNKTSYDSHDLARLFERGLLALGAKESRTIKVLPGQEVDGRGIAYVGKNGREGHSMVLILPPPWKMTFRRLTRLFEHEVLHTLGKEHSCSGAAYGGKGAKGCKPMTKNEYWSLGPVPSWAVGCEVRWNGAKRTGVR